MQQIENTHSSLPGIVVVGLLLDYLTRYYHHKKSLTTNTDEQIENRTESMAKAGFYYSPLKDNDDRALCFACTVTLVCWEPSDFP
ncbi:unnamed protein product [Rotaria sp. Silwood1]|nr:unnamed protein product [Rotaria sp. Silwood1]CAF4915504.1 unnamed protein product [Rotaria sp. Silwood1]